MSSSDADAVAAPAKRRKRNFTACHRCNSQKIKCSGGPPCRGCVRANVADQCSFPDRDRKITISERYLKRLQAQAERAQQLPAQMSERPSPNFEATISHSTDGPPPVANSLLAPTDGASSAPEQRVHRKQDHGSVPKPIYIGGAACTAFANHLKDQVHMNSESSSTTQLVEVYKHPVLMRQLTTSYSLPNFAYAQVLVRTMLRFVGHDYHFIRKKTFNDSMAKVYSGQLTASNVFLCKLLVIFALGELYLKRSSSSEGRRCVPGTSFFTQAVSLQQDLYEEPDVEYIETLVMMHWYSYVLNRKNTAFVYAGLAMRLSITLGLHRNIVYGATLPPGEIENRRRVFWAVYIFDRLSSAKLGHPVLMKDEDIDAPLPSTMEGLPQSEQDDFYDSTQLIATIKLCRIIGSILDLMYRRSFTQDEQFVNNVHKLLSDLKHWDATLPDVLKLSGNYDPPYSSRSVASLKLHFNQCVILTTRPVLLYVFKQQLIKSSNNFPSDNQTQYLSPISIAFSEACIYAARASEHLIQQLWIECDIATFGYFDAHYTFSVAVVLVISNLLKPNDEDKAASETAQSLLEFMSNEGSLPARECYERLVSLQNDLNNLGKSGACTVPLSFPNGDDEANASFATYAVPKPDSNTGVQGLSLMNGSLAEDNDLGGGTSIADMTFDAFLGDPSIQDFLDQPGNQWNPEIFDVGDANSGFWSLAQDTGASFNSLQGFL